MKKIIITFSLLVVLWPWTIAQPNKCGTDYYNSHKFSPNPEPSRLLRAQFDQGWYKYLEPIKRILPLKNF